MWYLPLQIIQEQSPKHPVEVCIHPDNKQRNRYANIQCCELEWYLDREFVYTVFDHVFSLSLAVDQTRCHLQPLEIEGHDHDYINANFIDVSEYM